LITGILKTTSRPEITKKQASSHLDRVLKLCQKHGIYAILDMHAAPGGQNANWHSDNDTGLPKFWEDASHRARLINLWGILPKGIKTNPLLPGSTSSMNRPLSLTRLPSMTF